MKCFIYALRGIAKAVLTERNLRIHLAVGFYALLFSLFYDFTALHYAVLVLTIAAVVAAEMVNTAIERFVDHETDRIEERAAFAKDAAAGAVLVTAVGAVAVGFCLFFDVAVFQKMVNYFCQQPQWLVWIVATVFLWILFIRNPRRRKKIQEENDDEK